MLRFNNQQSKPVDFYRPLTVDVSVEYELPKEVAPPPGSAPLLIIHPSAYFRSKIGHSTRHQGSRTQSQSSRTTPSSRHGPGMTNDLNSTLVYLTKGIGQDLGRSQPSNSSASHLKNLRAAYGGAASAHAQSQNAYSSTNSTTGTGSRSRSGLPTHGSRICTYGNCDECGVLNTHAQGNSSSSSAQILNKRINGGGSSSSAALTKKPLAHHLNYQSSGVERLPYSHSNNHNSSPSSNLMGSGMAMGFLDLGSYPTVSNIPEKPNVPTGQRPTFGPGPGVPATPATAAGHKRLRMMGQQNLQMNNPQSQPQYHPPPQPMEPLNLALTPSAPTQPSLLAPSYQLHNQFSTFGVPFSQSKFNGGNGGSIGLNYASTFPHHHASSLIPTTTAAMYNARLPKELSQYPVPVDKGSGSDSGVCSENDSDVSPPMAMAQPFTGQPRRSLLAPELPSSGCYCCCCPTTTATTTTANNTANVSSSNNNGSSTGTGSTVSSRKTSSASKGKSSLPYNNNSNSTMSTHSSKSQFIPQHNSFAAAGSSPSTTRGGVVSDAFASPINMMTSVSGIYGDGNHHGQLGNLSLSSSDPVSMALGNSHCSPMDSSSAAYQYRKWWTSGLIVDNSPHPSSLGRWFQV